MQICSRVTYRNIRILACIFMDTHTHTHTQGFIYHTKHLNGKYGWFKNMLN